jgi:integrase
MSTEEACKASTDQDSPADGKENTSAQAATGMNQKSGKQLANTIRATAGKNDSRYWLPRVFRPVNARGAASPHYSMKVQFRGRRMAFTLSTGNKDAAAKRAAAIYGELVAHGIEATLARRRAHRPEGEDVATIGEYLSAAQSVMAVRPVSFAAYAANLRRIAGDILNLRAIQRTKTRQKRATRQAIENAPVSILTAEAVQAWRLAFVARAGVNGTKARSARISSNSMIRLARSLFAPKVLKFLGALRLPDPLPFRGVEFFPRESMRYTSRIDAGVLMRQAREELAESDPESFLVMLLALAAGLRRGEIDRLLWRNVDFARGRIIVEESEHGQLKSADSRGTVDIDPRTVEILRGFQAKAQEQFVIEAKRAIAGEASRAWGKRYRCLRVFDSVNRWLRAHGIEGHKALHTLRKEAGAIVATRDGIFAASQFLRHRDIAITASVYADKKTRTVIDMGALLDAGESTPGNVIAMQPESTSPEPRGKARRK